MIENRLVPRLSGGVSGPRPELLFRHLPGGWLEVLEFVYFFGGISFCSNANARAARRFAPGRSSNVSSQGIRASRERNFAAPFIVISPSGRFSGLRHCRDRLHSAMVSGLRSIRNDDELR